MPYNLQDYATNNLSQYGGSQPYPLTAQNTFANSVLSPVQNLKNVVSNPSTVSTTIPADRLGQTTTTAPTIANPNTSNTTLGSMSAGAMQNTDALLASSQQLLDKAKAMQGGTTQTSGTDTKTGTKTETKDSGDSTVIGRIKEILGIQRGQGTDTEAAMQEGQVYEKQQKAQSLQNQYAAKERYYENKKRELEKNSEGMMASGLQGRLDDLDRQKNQELADIAIQYNAALGDYKTAYDIAQSKVDAKYEPLKNELETLKLMQTVLLNDMTDSEKLAAQEAINQREAEYNFAKQKEMAQYEAQLKQQYNTDNTTSTVGAITPEDKRTLLGSGIPEADIAELPQAIRDFGIDAVLKEYSGAQADAIRKVYNVSAAEPQFITKDFLTGLYTESALEEAAAEAGFGDMGKGLFNLKDVDTEAYIDYLLRTVESYRRAGMSDREILKLMQ